MTEMMDQLNKVHKRLSQADGRCNDTYDLQSDRMNLFADVATWLMPADTLEAIFALAVIRSRADCLVDDDTDQKTKRLARDIDRTATLIIQYLEYTTGVKRKGTGVEYFSAPEHDHFAFEGRLRGDPAPAR
ncbi:hypothetical protein [Limoniibacter endophyticus]|uniref:Uncharacterized protein n=1 Tax=Limoniibacter endophyticus TaxID=1565040 RepID=A0A8J3DGY6_9HYPH|nr:hypothetical protein [Limoniibacter endophyticus]GHC66615.1 hypothetical protein GCM10010136_09840 [Limoniibacter endophyticus]